MVTAIESLPPYPNGDLALLTTGETYTCTTDFTPGGIVWLAAPNITVQIDSPGVLRRSLRTHLDWDNTGDLDLGSHPDPNNCTIQGDGMMVTTNEVCIRGRRSGDITVKDLELDSTGDGMGCIKFASDTIFARNLVCRVHLTAVSNRSALPSVIESGNALDVADCFLIGGQVGTKGPGVVSKCIYVNDGLGTNPFNHVWFNLPGSATKRVSDCVGLNRNARGFIIDDSFGVEIYNNHILVKEVPNSEFGAALLSSCIKTRNIVQNGSKFYGNDFIAFSGDIGSTEYVGGAGIWLRHNSLSDMEIWNNRCRAVLLAAPHNQQRAAAFNFSKLGGAQGPTLDYIHNNILESNQHVVDIFANDADTFNQTIYSRLGPKRRGFRDNTLLLRHPARMYADWRAGAVAKLPTLPIYARVQTEVDDEVAALDAEFSVLDYIPNDQYHIYANSAPPVAKCDFDVWGSGLEEPNGNLKVFRNGSNVDLRVLTETEDALPGRGMSVAGAVIQQW